MTTVLMSASMDLGERISFGGQVLLIGMATVFASLAILWGVIAIFKIFMYDLPQKKAGNAPEKPKKAEKPAPKAAPAPAPVAAPAAPADDAALIAAITAAITAYTAEQNGGAALPFRVVSYKRLRGANGWTGADENESI